MTETLSSLSLPFMQLALAAGLLIGCTCAGIGVLLVLQRMVFVGAALAESAAAGVAIGLCLGSALDLPPEIATRWMPTATSVLATAAAILLVWLPWQRRAISREAVIGWAWVSALALTVLLVAIHPGGELHDVDLLSGNLLFLRPRDVVVLAATLPIVWALHVLLRKELIFAAFDPDTARTLGLRAGVYELLGHASIGLTIAVGMRLVGVIFVFSSLVVPPLTGLLLARRLGAATAWSVALCALSVVAGLLGSFALDLPSGPAIVLVQASLAVPVAAWRWARG